MIRDVKTARYNGLVSMGRQLGASLKVGLVGEKAMAQHGDSEYSVAEIGALNEMGVAAMNIPARPFIKNYFDINEKRIGTMLRTVTLVALKSSNPTKALQAGLSLLGQKLAGEIQGSLLRADGLVPNAESTAKKKGFNSPMIDTAQLYDAISYELVGRFGGML